MSAPPANGRARLLDLTLRAAVLAVILWIPVRVLSRGYLPPDDALRHAAKAVSGKPWPEIVLLRPEFTTDPHAGWHALLARLYAAGWSIVDLVQFSVVTLFVLFSVAPVLRLRRPDAWLLAFVAIGVAEPFFIDRWLMGRPLLLTAAVVPIVCLGWRELTGPRARMAMAVFTACAVLVTWIHGSFYLLALPVLAVAAARQWAAAVRLAAAFGIGIAAGACLTGQPLDHLQQVLWHAHLAAGTTKAAAALVTELQPFDGKPAVVAGFLALVAWRARRRGDLTGLTREPAVILTVLCWALGYVAHRFWIDWGAPALLAFAAMEIEDGLQSAGAAAPRGVVSALAGALLLLQTGADLNGRWTDPSGRPRLSRFQAAHAAWLPEDGGILYSADMAVFYSVFFENPHARWRYAVGFEPALAPPAEYEVYRHIKESRDSADAYGIWVRRMRSEDRLVVLSDAGGPPPIDGLEWGHPMPSVWSGRRPRRSPAPR